MCQEVDICLKEVDIDDCYIVMLYVTLIIMFDWKSMSYPFDFRDGRRGYFNSYLIGLISRKKIFRKDGSGSLEGRKISV